IAEPMKPAPPVTSARTLYSLRWYGSIPVAGRKLASYRHHGRSRRERPWQDAYWRRRAATRSTGPAQLVEADLGAAHALERLDEDLNASGRRQAAVEDRLDVLERTARDDDPVAAVEVGTDRVAVPRQAIFDRLHQRVRNRGRLAA